jgi:hypothetical protein
VELNFRRDADNMINFAQSEKRLRLLLTWHAEDEDRPINITPLKRPRERECGNQSQGEESDDDDEGFPEDYASINAYKEWLEDKGEDTGINTLFVLHQPHATVIVLLTYKLIFMVTNRSSRWIQGRHHRNIRWMVKGSRLSARHL